MSSDEAMGKCFEDIVHNILPLCSKQYQISVHIVERSSSGQNAVQLLQELSKLLCVKYWESNKNKNVIMAVNDSWKQKQT